MASFLIRPLRPLAVGLTASAVLYSAAAPLLSRPSSFRLACDDGPPAVSSHDWSFDRYSREARTPVVRKGRVNPRIWRQISSGSIIGVLGGLAVSTFSKPLALLIGLLVLGNQFLESRGIHLVPYGRIQKYAKGIDVRSALQDNIAFKLAFGATFSLAAFAEF